MYIDNFIELIKKDGSREMVSERSIPGLRFNFLGKNNHIIIHEGTKFTDCSFSFISDMTVEIGKTPYEIHKLYLFGNGSKIEIGDYFSCWGVEIRCHEQNTSVKIGENCMFSEDILIYPTDEHAIFDIENGELLNLGGSVIIDDHVWCGRDVKFLKGCKVSQNTVISMGSFVTSSHLETNVMLSGYPAKVTKKGINWARETPFRYLASRSKK